MTYLPNYLAMRSILAIVLACLACCDSTAAQSVTLVQQVNRAPAAPIMWQTPDAIPFGTPLSAVQLNATSPTVGTFTYQPATGAILPSGTNPLSVVLSPLDQNYATESAAVSIIVVPPGSSTFTVMPLSASSPENPLRLMPGVPATIQIAVGPVGDFHQPVTLSCSVPASRRSCFFSPSVIRPTTSTVQVSLTLAPLDGAKPSHMSTNLLPPNFSTYKGLLPGLTSSALFAVLFFRRRLRGLSTWAPMASALLVLPFLTMLSGCGTGYYHPIEKIEIRGSSLMETRTSQIYVLDSEDELPGLEPHTRQNGGAR